MKHLRNVLSIRRWRTFLAVQRATFAYKKNDFESAIEHLEDALRREGKLPAAEMTFYALMLSATPGRKSEVTALLPRIIAGEFRGSSITPETAYAEAFAHYLLAFLTDQTDVLDRWLEAFRLRQAADFSMNILPLPEKPLLA